MADWRDASGKTPWDEDTPTGWTRYLSTCSLDELSRLAEWAFIELDGGGWQGVKTANGGYVDGEPWNDNERAWRAAARDFYERFEAGDRCLTEGMIRYAAYDLAQTLAWLRSWCGWPRGVQ